MDQITNPYSPGAGRKPAALVGRDSELERWQVALRRIESDRGAQSVALYGLRGVGKTVLLSELAKMARDREWLTVRIEAAPGMSLREGLGEALHAPLADLARPSAGRRLLKALKTAVSFKASYDTAGSWNFGVDLNTSPGGGADTGTLETDLRKLISDVAQAAAEESVGLAILIDEAQDLNPDELVAVCSIIHAAGQDGLRLIVALAGLPSLPRILAEARSYSERLFAYVRIEELGDDLAREAIARPAALEEVCWDDEALDLVVQSAGGYPYFLQQFGQESWNEAPSAPITSVDARVGIVRGQSALDAGFFRARWDRATRGEQKYLRAMADDGDVGSRAGDVADRLERKVTSLGPIRANLIAKGLVYAPEHGVVAFTVPGMAGFISRQPTE
ncbi:MAG: AAA family ATPase [Leifsonia sp.]